MSQTEQAPTTTEVERPRRLISKFEKKARQSLQKMGFRAVTDIQRATMKKGEAFVFAIEPCDVFQKDNHYAIFGEGRVDETAARLGSQLASLSQSMGNNTAPSNPMASNTFNPFQMGGKSDDGEDVEDDETEDVDAEQEETKAGLDFSNVSFSQQDLDLVVSQANTTPDKAFEALEKTGGDTVTAIMELTM